MKSVSWDEAFRKLNEWRERESAISFGDVRDDVDAQGNASPMHFFGPIVRVVSADATTGVVSLSGEYEICFGLGPGFLRCVSFRIFSRSALSSAIMVSMRDGSIRRARRRLYSKDSMPACGSISNWRILSTGFGLLTFGTILRLSLRRDTSGSSVG